MRHSFLVITLVVMVGLLAGCAATQQTSKATPICVHPDNPHYFLFRHQPAILITSAEHYGTVVNLDFDYVAYLDVLVSRGMDYTRIYPGAYFETDGYFISDNVLGPRNSRHSLPWARSSVPGYPLGGNKFDLDSWDNTYFERLKDFITKAGNRGIVVEICFFNGMYPDLWAKMPLYCADNIQGVGTCDYKDVQTLKDKALVARQQVYIRKITQEVNKFDNVILEICDEPGIKGTPADEYTPWVRRMVDVIVETEKKLPNKHLIAQQVCGTLAAGGDFSADSRVQVITGQYVWMASAGQQFGGMQLLDCVYEQNKPIELNETNYYPLGYKGDKIAASRVEAWEFIVGGGAGFNQLNSLYSTYNPTAAGTENNMLLRGLENLKHFMYSFDFIKMSRDTSFVASGVPAGAFAHGISQPPNQYALYIHHSILSKGVEYIVQPGTYQENLVLHIGAGNYRSDWVEPATGNIICTDTFSHSGGNRAFTTPQYSVDIALRIKKLSPRQ